MNTESHIPLSLRQWLDEKIEKEINGFSRPVFCGLRSALTEKSPAEEIAVVVNYSRFPTRN